MKRKRQMERLRLAAEEGFVFVMLTVVRHIQIVAYKVFGSSVATNFIYFVDSYSSCTKIIASCLTVLLDQHIAKLLLP